KVAPGLGTGFRGLWRSLFSTGWRCEFWICHGVWFPFAKDVERRDRTVFSVLADELWLMGSPFPGIDRPLWLARLENWLALGQETAGRHCVRPVRGCDLRHWVLRSNRAVGLGQSQTHGLGILSHSSIFVERFGWALGVS